jgi:hypothetical protein
MSRRAAKLAQSPMGKNRFAHSVIASGAVSGILPSCSGRGCLPRTVCRNRTRRTDSGSMIVWDVWAEYQHGRREAILDIGLRLTCFLWQIVPRKAFRSAQFVDRALRLAEIF